MRCSVRPFTVAIWVRVRALQIDLVEELRVRALQIDLKSTPSFTVTISRVEYDAIPRLLRDLATTTRIPFGDHPLKLERYRED